MLRAIMSGVRATLRQPYLDINRRLGRAVKPLFFHYAVTWRCNARCSMCATWRVADPKGGESPVSTITVDELDGILARDERFLGSLRKVGLTGGEPFLRKDIVELVRCLHERLPRAHISLVSNGLLTGTILAKLEEIRSFLPGMVFSVSLDGLDEVHDQIRGVPGAFVRSMATIKGAQALGFNVTSGLTISPHNCHQIEPVAELLAQLGVNFSCNLMEQGVNFHNAGSKTLLDSFQTAQVLKALQKFRHHYYMDNLALLMKGFHRTLPCYAGVSSYFLAPDGDLLLCNLLGKAMGNLRQASFADIANSQRAWDLRQLTGSCTCWSQCEVKNSAASAPWHVLRWLVRSPHKAVILSHLKQQALRHL